MEMRNALADVISSVPKGRPWAQKNDFTLLGHTLRGPRFSWVIRALVIFKNTQYHKKALELILYLNFENSMEEFTEQKRKKCN
jgi:hypothetical protein